MCSFKFFTIFALFFVLTIYCNKSYAVKRSCGLYGHSCYGGYGKRADMSSEQSIMMDTPVQERASAALYIPDFRTGFGISRPVRYLPVTPEQYQEVAQFLDKRDASIDQPSIQE